jgi:hypothetical protein
MREDYATYDEYLKSPEWRKLRDEALEKANHTCAICGAKENLNVHHCHYRNIDTPELVVLCKDCHAMVHRILKSVHARIAGTEMRNASYRAILNARAVYFASAFGDAINREFPRGIPYNKAHFCGLVRGFYIDYYNAFKKGPFGYYFNGYTGKTERESLIPGADKISHYLIKRKK